jgi:hypothetical protein
MGMNVENIDTKLRSNMKFLTDRETKEIKSQYRKAMDIEKPSVTLLISEIPMFPESNSSENDEKKIKPSTEIRMYKISEYKQHYGGKFTRINQNVENSGHFSKGVS